MKVLRHANLPQLGPLDLQQSALVAKLRRAPAIRSVLESRVRSPASAWASFEANDGNLAFAVRPRPPSAVAAVLRRGQLAAAFAYVLHRNHAGLLRAAFGLETFEQIEYCGRLSLIECPVKCISAEEGGSTVDLVLLKACGIAPHCTATAPAPSRELFDFLKRQSIELLLSCGRTSVALAEFQGLAPGDVVLLGAHGPDADTVSVDIVLSHNLARLGGGKVQGALLEITSVSNMSESESNLEEGGADGQLSKLSGLEMLEIDLMFIVARKRLKVKELMALEPGSLIDLKAITDSQAPVAVDIVMQSSVVGTGVLVSASGRLGVCIESMLARKADAS